MKTIVGIRPTGKLHIGHYLSVIKPALEEKALVLIADYHGDWSLSHELYEELNSYGVHNIKFQAHSFQPKLYFSLLKLAKVGELKRMPQFKVGDDKTAHLLTYPVLMAHDIANFDRVIVGNDQKQHVEYANVLFKRMGLPKIEGDYRGGRVMSLVNPFKKMSKSEPKGCLFLKNPKVGHAVTSPAGRKNLEYIYFSLTGRMWDENKNMEMKIKLEKAVKNLVQ